jgi:hypothetical protein
MNPMQRLRGAGADDADASGPAEAPASGGAHVQGGRDAHHAGDLKGLADQSGSIDLQENPGLANPGGQASWYAPPSSWHYTTQPLPRHNLSPPNHPQSC